MKKYFALKEQLIKDAASKKMLLAGEFELTARCNFSCAMCYVVHQEKQKELTSEEWIDIFRQARDKGMMFALLTGGEIFRREDFFVLYETLYDMGVRITLFSNASLITEEIAARLAKRKPDYVAVTLYGASDATYQTVTKDKEGFTKAKKGIAALQKYKIPVVLRTLALKETFADLDPMIAYAKDAGLILQSSLYVSLAATPCAPKRLNAGEVYLFLERINEAFGTQHTFSYQCTDTGFSCSALRSSFFVNYQGYLQPCAMLDSPKESVRNHNLYEVFLALQKETENKSYCAACKECALQASCLQCPARLYLEQSQNQCSAYLKSLAKYKQKRGVL